VEKIQKPYFISQTVMPPYGLDRRHPGRPPKVAPSPAATAAGTFDDDVARDRVRPLGGLHPLKPLIREWLLELKVMGRSPRTIKWYEQKLDWYFRADGVQNLEALTAFELKRFLAEQQERGLSDNTIHGFFQVIRTFANWCLREEYPVDRTLLRVRPPKVALKEMSTYTEDQVSAIFNARSRRLAADRGPDPAWHRRPSR
jgi:integrase